MGVIPFYKSFRVLLQEKLIKLYELKNIIYYVLKLEVVI